MENIGSNSTWRKQVDCFSYLKIDQFGSQISSITGRVFVPFSISGPLKIEDIINIITYHFVSKRKI